MSRVLGAASALCLLGLATMPACVAPQRHRKIVEANHALQVEMQDLERMNAAYQRQNKQLSQKVEALEPVARDAEYVREQKAKLKALLEKMKPEGGPSLPKGVTIASSPEGAVLRVEGQVLFSPGKAELSSEGKDTLRQLVPALYKRGRPLRVGGHTDSDPIKHSRWKTNLRLSAERALEVAEFLIQNGLDKGMVSIAGYGENRPVGDGEKSKDRRVEIVLLH